MKKILSLIIFSIILLISSSSVYAEYRDPNTWVPSSGWADVSPSQVYPDTVFIFNTFSWNSWDGLTGFWMDENETLEMDLHFLNPNSAAYSIDWYNYSSIGYRGVYWETNQPLPYWDTQAGDGYDERVFTVGCSDAHLYEPSITYYWWGYGIKNPLSNGSWAKISAQRGTRIIPYLFESTWNVLSEQTEFVVGFYNWYAPSNYSWTY